MSISKFDGVFKIMKMSFPESEIRTYEGQKNLLNNYYSEDLCMFKDGKCIVQRENNSNSFNGCCMRCPIVTEKGCPSDNITCKLVYCKKALGNMKLLKFKDIKILKCFSISQRLIILSGAFSTREEVIKDLYYGLLYSVFRNFYKKIKSILAKVNLKKN